MGTWKKWRSERSLGQLHQLCESSETTGDLATNFCFYCLHSAFSLLQVQSEIVKEAWPSPHWGLCPHLTFRHSSPCTRGQASSLPWLSAGYMHLIRICCADSVFSLLQVQTEIVKESWPPLRWRLCITRYSHPCTCSQASKPCWVEQAVQSSVLSLFLSLQHFEEDSFFHIHLGGKWVICHQGEYERNKESCSNFFSHQPEAVNF